MIAYITARNRGCFCSSRMRGEQRGVAVLAENGNVVGTKKGSEEEAITRGKGWVYLERAEP